MQRFIESHLLLEEMYEDQYYPKFLVDKLKFFLMDLISYLDEEKHSKVEVQEKLDEVTININNLRKSFTRTTARSKLWQEIASQSMSKGYLIISTSI